MKTFSKCLATVLAVAGVATLAGCNKGSTNYRVATTANWNVRTSTSVEKNSFEDWQKNKEFATYTLSFTAGTNSSYKVTYDDGAVYTTEFYMLESYDWNTDTIEEYQSKETDTEPVYVYKTSLKISGTYQISDSKKDFDDVLETECYFRPAGKNLQPVYSYQKVINTAPAALSAGSIGATYVQINEVYKTYYNKSCSQATVKKISYDKSEDVEVEGKGNDSTTKISLASGYSSFDNSQIRAAIRAFTLSGGSSRTFYTVSPQNGGVQSVTASISSPVELNGENEEHKSIIKALDDAPDNYIFFDGTIPDKQENQKDRNYRFNAVSLSINEELRGTSPTMWYTTVENNDVNSTRCVLLKMSTPLTFGLGTLHYTLNSLTVTPVE